MRKTPWHAKDESVFHESTLCEAGRTALQKAFTPGTGGKPRCPECDRAESAGDSPGNSRPGLI